MTAFSDNASCILTYLELFQALSASSPSTSASNLWNTLRHTQANTKIPLAPSILKKRFHLSQWDMLLVMAALALEMDGGLREMFRRRYGLPRPTVEYGLQLIDPLCPNRVETLSQLSAFHPLCGLLLVPAGQVAYPLERPLILCRAALSFLTGFSLADIPGMTSLTVSEKPFVPLHQDASAQIKSWYAAHTDTPLWLLASTGSGRRTVLCEACGGAVCLDMTEAEAQSAAERNGLFREAAVTACLMSAPVCAVSPTEQRPLTELERLCKQFHIPLAILTDDSKMLQQTVEVVYLSDRLSSKEREMAWNFFLPQAEPHTSPDGSMSIKALKETADLAQRIAKDAGQDTVDQAAVKQAIRRQSGAAEFGIRHDVSVTLADLVLPETVQEQIALLCQMAQNRNALDHWGLRQYRGGGVTAVFHGPPGTGKTMAAEAIAGSLQLPLLCADLSQIMDKYIGETEKHLSRLLTCARENQCVLLFDEADALFGRRTETVSSHDKYSNLSTSYLLQEMERYEGVALLSTNLLSNFDEAFLRRLHSIIRFPMPDAAQRELLWRRALPPERLEGEIPYAMLAQVELSPARINNAARNAAIAALADGQERVNAAGLIRGLKWELEKNGKSLPQNGRWTWDS